MKNLKLYRARKGLSQREISQRVQVSVNMITLLEKPDYLSITTEKLNKIAEVLECDPFELIGNENLKFKPENDTQRVLFLKNFIADIEDEELRDNLWDCLKM